MAPTFRMISMHSEVDRLPLATGAEITELFGSESALHAELDEIDLQEKPDSPPASLYEILRRRRSAGANE